MPTRGPYFDNEGNLKSPSFEHYVPTALEYLDLERQLHEAQRQIKAWKRRMYAISNEMSKISSHKLGLLGHQVVDTLRQRQGTESSPTKQGKSTSR